ncbi:MAG TPA: HD domain-containing phosphohydrolase [Thermoanaerobaculia bacterium]|nr:HD domain-containing phosphohydrolase [Thermoanaerobaculia bacterium]
MIAGLSETLTLLTGLSRAVATRAMYPGDHPSVRTTVDGMIQGLEACLARRGDDAVTFLVIDGDVVLDEQRLASKSMYLRPFARTMERLGIQRLTLAHGLDAAEAQGLVDALAGISPVAGSDHVTVGVVALGDGAGAGAGAARAALDEADLDRGAQAFRGLRGPGAAIEHLDHLVWRVVEAVAGSSRSLLLLAPAQELEPRLFLHSVNVAALAVALGRSLGIAGPALHAIGLGALLHDVGKLELPEELWSEEEHLDDERGHRAQLHPELGAALLAGIVEVPPLAVLVAYEHHLRWDGKPSYPRCTRLPGLASQITAVADTWDVLAGLSGDLVAARPQALDVWRRRAGTVLDPFLVGSFLQLMAEGGASPS